MCFSSLGHEIKLSTKYTHETDRHIIDSMVETIRIRPLELMMTIESQQIETHKSIRELERHTHTHTHTITWYGEHGHPFHQSNYYRRCAMTE